MVPVTETEGWGMIEAIFLLPARLYESEKYILAAGWNCSETWVGVGGTRHGVNTEEHQLSLAGRCVESAQVCLGVTGWQG